MLKSKRKQDKGLVSDGSAFSIQVVRRGSSELIFRDLIEMKEQTVNILKKSILCRGNSKYKNSPVEAFLASSKNCKESWLERSQQEAGGVGRGQKMR